MDLEQLRIALREPIVALHHHTAKEFPSICETLGLPAPCEGETKQKVMRATFDAAIDDDLPDIAARFLKSWPPSAAVRNQIEDLLWANIPIPEISKKVRREVAEGLSAEDLYSDADEFVKLLESIWVLDDELGAFAFEECQLLKDVRRHVMANPDWSVVELFKKLGAFESSSQRFVRFLEGLASPELRPSADEQKGFAQKVNKPLRNAGIELRETGERDGYPVFTACSLRTVPANAPKNLIFASKVKPDLRIPDMISNTIEIVSNADKVLVYDQPIGSDGLRWGNLQAWWAKKQNMANDDEAKKSLYNRLKSSLPTESESPPQQRFFTAYHKAYGPRIPRLPALLPEVWLHWDPQTVAQRGRHALVRFRMDFLMLLPNGGRVVFEIDGKHHYTNDDGKSNPTKYARMIAADRELKLTGYEVFRFGATELKSDDADQLVKDFFADLFRVYKVELSR